jgi:CubicO group peptidase (beta-lactamase class C family)
MSSTSSDAGLDAGRLAYLKKVITDDIDRGRYYGGVIAIARHGVLGLHEAIGAADAAGTKPLREDSVFSLFSVTKAITNTLVFRAIELGQFALTTRISEIIPEFSGGLRQSITVTHLLTHTSGLPSVYSPRPGMCIDRLDEIIGAICENVHAVDPPGNRVDYSPMANHALLGEMVRRGDPQGRSFRQIMDDEIFKPLGMKDTSMGLRADLRSRHVVPDFRGNNAIQHLGRSNLGPNGAFEEEHAEMPWVGVASTVPDMFRFAEMLRRGGELDGKRIVSPTVLRMARRNWTGEKPNELYKALAYKLGWDPFPAYIGLGFTLRGPSLCHTLFGTLTSPETFGNYGAGSTLFWVDPELDLTFVCLTAGVMTSGENFERFQRLSDIAASAAT